MIGVTEAGFKAQQMNAIINVKTAEKGFQFLVKKCKTMLIGNASDAIVGNLTDRVSVSAFRKGGEINV